MRKIKRLLLVFPLLAASFYLGVCMMNYQSFRSREDGNNRKQDADESPDIVYKEQSSNGEDFDTLKKEMESPIPIMQESTTVTAKKMFTWEKTLHSKVPCCHAYHGDMENVETMNNKRLERVEAVCRKYNIGLYKNSQKPTEIKHPPTPQYSVFYFDRTNKWALCPIYKAGSSTWLFNLLILAGMTEEQITNSGKQLSELARGKYSQLDPSAAETELHSSTKILTVRHPFERLLSAYRDKLENINHGAEHGTHHFYRSYGNKIVQKYRRGGNATKNIDLMRPGEYLWNPGHPQPAGVEPTFEEFVRFLIDSNIVASADDHWIPYYLFCTPCLLQYNFIATMETFGQDQQYIIRALGLHDKIKAIWRHKTQFTNNDGNNNVSAIAQRYFRQLTAAQITQLYEKYQIDFELFGYSYEEYLHFAKDS